MGILTKQYLLFTATPVIHNDYGTEYFDCPIGVKQGDCLSPTLFEI